MHKIVIGMLIVLVSAVGWTQTIYIDMDGQSTNPSGNWNTMSYPLTLTDLIDNNGAATTVDVDATSFGYHGTGGWTAGTIDWLDSNAAYDFIATPGTSTVVISQLPGTEYRIELVAGRSGSDIGDYTIDGAFANRTHNGAGTSDDWDLAAARTNGNWMIWDSVTPTSGQITIQASLVSGNDATVNAIMITDVIVPVELMSFSVE